MNKKANIIELNGKRYDAATGKLLAVTGEHAVPTKVIDGFVRSSLHTNTGVATQQHSKPRASEKTHTAPSIIHNSPSQTTRKALDIHRAVAQHASTHRPERAKTLMRHTVERPQVSLKRHVKAVTHTGTLVKQPRFDIVPKPSISDMDERRLKRAKRIAKSNLISRFGNLLQTAPTSHIVTIEKPIRRPEPTQQHALKPYASPKQASAELFDRALARANSHLQPRHPAPHGRKSQRTRLTSIAASSLAIVLIISFIAYQNTANIQMHIASSRAGISAALPKWRPTGFTAAKFSYAPGTVVVAFKSDNSPRDFSLAQTATNWDSNTLLDDFVSQQSSTYNTIESNGRLIYTYGNNNATWVDGGIWYTLTTNGSLSSTQLIHIASST